jgi:hypothetical protein
MTDVQQKPAEVHSSKDAVTEEKQKKLSLIEIRNLLQTKTSEAQQKANALGVLKDASFKLLNENSTLNKTYRRAKDEDKRVTAEEKLAENEAALSDNKDDMLTAYEELVNLLNLSLQISGAFSNEILQERISKESTEPGAQLYMVMPGKLPGVQSDENVNSNGHMQIVEEEESDDEVEEAPQPPPSPKKKKGKSRK